MIDGRDASAARRAFDLRPSKTFFRLQLGGVGEPVMGRLVGLRGIQALGMFSIGEAGAGGGREGGTACEESSTLLARSVVAGNFRISCFFG